MSVKNSFQSMCQKHPFVMGFIIFLVLLTITGLGKRCHEKYMMSPTSVTTSGTQEPSGLFNLPYNLDCTPGANNGAYYTKDLTPGGLCGGQTYVNGMANYKIMDGVGGSLFP